MKEKKYLFFDLEYASSKAGVHSICEFGYVLVDQNFQILDRNNLIINPNISNAEWDYRALRTLLKRTKVEYEKEKSFQFFYKSIVNLIQSADLVLGHTLDGDVKALNDDCIKYSLDSIDFDFYDIRYFYRDFKNSNKDTSLTNTLEELQISANPKYHDAEADAENTMKITKVMLEKLEMSLDELISLSPRSKARNENFIVLGIAGSRKQWMWKFKNFLESSEDIDISEQWTLRLLDAFIEACQPLEGNNQQVLAKQSIYLSIYKIKTKLKHTLNLIQFIVNLGGKVVLDKKESNIFVTQCDYETDECADIASVQQLNEEEKDKFIQIIQYHDFLKLLNITSETLDNLPMVNFDCLWKIQNPSMFRWLQPAFHILKPNQIIAFDFATYRANCKKKKKKHELNSCFLINQN